MLDINFLNTNYHGVLIHLPMYEYILSILDSMLGFLIRYNYSLIGLKDVMKDRDHSSVLM